MRDDTCDSGDRNKDSNFKSSEDNKELTNLVKVNMKNKKSNT